MNAVICGAVSSLNSAGSRAHRRHQRGALINAAGSKRVIGRDARRAAGPPAAIVDLNPHLIGRLWQETATCLGDPRRGMWSDGATVCHRHGSNNLTLDVAPSRRLVEAGRGRRVCA
jgi:hypothetical protein